MINKGLLDSRRFVVKRRSRVGHSSSAPPKAWRFGQTTRPPPEQHGDAASCNMAKSVSSPFFDLIHKTHADLLQIIYKHYQRILTQWPVDRLRPEVSFQKIIQRRIDTQLKPSTTQPQDNVVSNQAQATIPSPVPFDEQGQLEQVNVLYSFLENRYQKKVGR